MGDGLRKTGCVLSCEGVGEDEELRAKACDDGLGESRARAVEARRFVSS
jgi:hypothetical protein